MKRKKAVALVIVIVLILLFSAIILSVVLTSTTAYRRSAYFRDRNIAFNLAHLGIADALYRLNYRYHDPAHYYGFRPDGECLLYTDGLPTNNTTYSYSLKASELGFINASINDGVTVQLMINDGTYGDTILATGKYRGRTAKISVNIRTLSDENTNLQRPLADITDWDTKGIPEAFNKHVIYAQSVSDTGTKVKGNIATTFSKQSPWPAEWTDATWTQTDISLPRPLIPSLPFEIRPLEIRPPDPPGAGWVEFQMRDQARYRIDGGSWQLLPPGGGVDYNFDGTGTETFIFTSIPPFVENRKIYVRASFAPAGRSGGACFDGRSTPISVVNSVLADGSITFYGDINLSEDAIFEADVNNDGVGTVIIQPKTTFTGSDLIIYDYNGNGSSVINHSDITINGALVTNCSLTIGSTANNLTIDATNSTKSAALTIYSPSNFTFTLNSTPNIILGNNQSHAFLLLSTTQPIVASLGNSGNVNFEANPIENLGDKSTIVAYSTASSASIIVGSTANHAKIPGLIYSSGNISLNNANTFINGCLVAGGTVTLNNGSLNYDRNVLAPDRFSIYSGFAGGRRIYLPVNWKIQW